MWVAHNHAHLLNPIAIEHTLEPALQAGTKPDLPVRMIWTRRWRSGGVEAAVRSLGSDLSRRTKPIPSPTRGAGWHHQPEPARRHLCPAVFCSEPNLRGGGEPTTPQPKGPGEG